MRRLRRYIGRIAHHQSTRRSGEEGVTLLELVVAIAIASLLGLFLYQVVNDQNKIFKRQDTVTRLQQNLRFSMEFLARSIEMAGYGTYGYTTGITVVPAISVIDGGAGSPDQLQVLFADPTELAIMPWGTTVGCSATTLPLSSPSGASLPTAWYFNDATHMLCYSFVDSNKLESYLFQVTSVDLSTNDVEVVTPTGHEPFDTECGANFPPDMLCAPANWHIFYIDNEIDGGGGPGTPENPTLMMRESDVPLTTAITPNASDFLMAENIEHMDLNFCLEGSDCSSSGVWNTTFTSAQAELVRQVQVTLWAKSEKISDTTTLYPDPLTGTVDGAFRVTTTSTVLVRNLRRLNDYN